MAKLLLTHSLLLEQLPVSERAHRLPVGVLVVDTLVATMRPFLDAYYAHARDAVAALQAQAAGKVPTDPSMSPYGPTMDPYRPPMDPPWTPYEMFVFLCRPRCWICWTAVCC